jgi:hypothetical protein
MDPMRKDPNGLASLLTPSGGASASAVRNCRTQAMAKARGPPPGLGSRRAVLGVDARTRPSTPRVRGIQDGKTYPGPSEHEETRGGRAKEVIPSSAEVTSELGIPPLATKG